MSVREGKQVRRRRRSTPLGCLAIAAGVMILFAMFLPPGFWWFVLAAALIVIGISLIRMC